MFRKQNYKRIVSFLLAIVFSFTCFFSTRLDKNSISYACGTCGNAICKGCVANFNQGLMIDAFKHLNPNIADANRADWTLIKSKGVLNALGDKNAVLGIIRYLENVPNDPNVSTHPKLLDASISRLYTNKNLMAFLRDNYVIGLLKHPNGRKKLISWINGNKLPAIEDSLGSVRAIKALFGHPVFKAALFGYLGLMALFCTLFLLTSVINNSTDLTSRIRNTLRNFRRAPKIDYSNKVKILCDIRKRLDSKIVGQDKAKIQILRNVASYLEAMNQSLSTGIKLKRGLFFYIIGPSGTGKSSITQCIADVLGKECFWVKRNDVREDPNKNVVQQLTEPQISFNGRIQVSRKSNFQLQVEHGKNTMFIFDEYEKITKCDKEHSLDELIFRDYVDSSHIGVYDCSGSIIVCTSNETLEELKANHDPSIVNRIMTNVVVFEPHNLNNYKQLIKLEIDKIQKYYLKDYGINVLLSSESINKMADKIYRLDRGAREVHSMIDVLRGELLNYRSDNNNFTKATMNVKYDSDKNKFVLSHK